jgi:lysyl-tRNA synthetase, class I
MLWAMPVMLLLAAMRTRMGALIKHYGRDNVFHLIERALAGDDLGKAA